MDKTLTNNKIPLSIYSLLLFLSSLLSACNGGGGGSSTPDDRPPQFETNPVLRLSEEEKITLLEEEGRPALLTPSVDLFISETSEKPDTLPGEDEIGRSSSYKKSYHATFIEQGKDETRWFATQPNEEASSIIWQVADAPFIENDPNWTEPTGLLGTGSVSGSASEFQVDFSVLAARSSKLSRMQSQSQQASENPTLNPTQASFFARAVAVDRSGNSVGNISKGVELVYGAAITEKPDISDLQILFPLLSGEHAGLITTGEIENALVDRSEQFYQSSSVEPWYFRPSDYPSGTHSFYIQVLKTPPTVSADGWRDPTGLVQEIRLLNGEEEFNEFATNPWHAIPIDIKALATKSPEQFYIRVVALRSGTTLGSVIPSFSKTVIVKYGAAESDFTYYVPPEIISFDANLPNVNLLSYEPIRWAYSDWTHYYEVVRQPTQKEYYTLIPEMFLPKPNALMEDLPVGTVIHFTPPPPEDTSWLQDAWNAVTSFFSSLTNFLSDVANWVSESYDELKADLVTFVASNLPLVPPDLRDELHAALTYGLDYGLASVGIPPSLPNFDELSSMGADYLAATALEQAGIPANEITTDTVKKLGDKVSDGLVEKANKGGSPNPLNWSFVKPYAPAIYRQAYIEFEISNPSSEETPPGILKGKVFRELESSELGDSNKMDISTAYGGLYFELYRRVSDVQIPRLLPGQTLRIPIFLEEYTDATYPWAKLPVQPNDFLKMYNYFDHFTFSFNIEFILPPAQQAAVASGLSANELYEYPQTSKGFNFTGDPAMTYTP